MNELVQKNELFPGPKTAQEAYQLANTLSESKLIPQAFQKKPNDVFVAMMWSANLGVPFIQGIQGIAVIGGKPSIYGDLGLAICLNSGLVESFKEEFIEHSEFAKTREGKSSNTKNVTARCTILRKGIADPFVSEFSIEDAFRAGLWGKTGPWTQYPRRMLQMRARAFALRNAFPDRLMGMSIAEEMQDIVDVSESGEVSVTAAPKKMPVRKPKAKVVAEDAVQAEPTPTPDPEPEPVKESPVLENNPTSDDLFSQQVAQAANSQPEPEPVEVDRKAVVEPVLNEVAKVKNSGLTDEAIAKQRADIAAALETMSFPEVRQFWDQIKDDIKPHCMDLFRARREALGVANPKIK